MPSDWISYGQKALECIILHRDGLEPSARLDTLSGVLEGIIRMSQDYVALLQARAD
jgi:hypothetical protein